MKISSFKNHPALVVSLLAGVLCGGAFALSYGLTASKKESLAPALMQELTHLSSRMDELNHKSSIPPIDLNPITQKMDESLKEWGNQTQLQTEQLDHHLDQTETTLTHHLDTLHQQIESLDSKQHPVRYLLPEALPFHVLSIDMIQGVAVASIAYDFKTVPLEKDDSLAGWKIIHLDFSTQHIEFENAKKERVLIRQEFIG